MSQIAKRIALSLLFVVASIRLCAGAAHEYLLIFHVSSDANIKAIAEAYDAKVLDSLGDNTYLFNAKSLSPKSAVSGIISVETDAAINSGRGSGWVLSVKPGKSPDWYSGQPAFQLISADDARAISTGKGVVIADINSAIDYSHPALRGHLTGGYDFVIGQPSDVTLNQSTASFLDQSTASFLDQSTASFLDQSTASFLDQSTASFLDQSTASFLDGSNPAHGHGTMVAGILAAIAPDAMIMPIRAFDDSGQANEFSIAKAIHWAVDHGADVINMSFGAPDPSKAVKDAIEYANQNGVTMVASAGNDNTTDRQYPAGFDKVLSIAATNLLDMKAPFSNYGDSVNAAAPGVAIITPYPGGYYAVASGTSFSAPIVAGEAALLRSLLQKQNLKNRITQAVQKIDNRNPGMKLGGRVDIELALEKK